jgi:hypothetical protein
MTTQSSSQGVDANNASWTGLCIFLSAIVKQRFYKTSYFRIVIHPIHCFLDSPASTSQEHVLISNRPSSASIRKLNQCQSLQEWTSEGVLKIILKMKNILTKDITL